MNEIALLLFVIAIGVFGQTVSVIVKFPEGHCPKIKLPEKKKQVRKKNRNLFLILSLSLQSFISMKVVKLLLATNNAKKVEEIRKILPSCFELLTLKDIDFSLEIPETTNTIVGNSCQKAWFVFSRTGLNCLSDDSGLEIKALSGRPGVDSAHYAGMPPDNVKNIDLVLKEMEGLKERGARFVTVMTLILDGNEHQFEGEISGSITTSPIGANGFGYDPIFVPAGFEITFAQMEAVDKNMISHRAEALEKLKNFFASKA